MFPRGKRKIGGLLGPSIGQMLSNLILFPDAVLFAFLCKSAIDSELPDVSPFWCAIQLTRCPSNCKILFFPLAEELPATTPGLAWPSAKSSPFLPNNFWKQQGNSPDRGFTWANYSLLRKFKGQQQLRRGRRWPSSGSEASSGVWIWATQHPSPPGKEPGSALPTRADTATKQREREVCVT